jgi:hypothetical protein
LAGVITTMEDPFLLNYLESRTVQRAYLSNSHGDVIYLTFTDGTQAYITTQDGAPLQVGLRLLSPEQLTLPKPHEQEFPSFTPL